jgi:hypothetical protein
MPPFSASAAYKDNEAFLRAKRRGVRLFVAGHSHRLETITNMLWRKNSKVSACRPNMYFSCHTFLLQIRSIWCTMGILLTII